MPPETPRPLAPPDAAGRRARHGTAVSERASRYSFGPLERRGLLGPRPGARRACLAVGVLAWRSSCWTVAVAGRGARGADRLTASARPCALLPLGGRSVAEWGPVAGAHLRRRRRVAGTGFVLPGRHSRRRESVLAPRRRLRLTAPEPLPSTPAPGRPDHLGRLPRADHRRPRRGFRPPADRSARLPRAGLCPARSGRPGAPPGPLGSGPASGRGIVRSGGCSGSSARRRRPVDELARWVHAERDPARAAAGRADDRLLPRADRSDRRHGSADARGPDRVQIDARRGPRAAAGRSGRRPLVEAAERVARGLRAAEVTVLGALWPRAARPDSAHRL